MQKITQQLMCHHMLFSEEIQQEEVKIGLALALEDEY